MKDAANPAKSASHTPTRAQRWLQAVGLHRPELRAWAMYDWANSAFATTIMAAVLPIYYSDVAASHLPAATRTAYWGYTSGFALLVVAVLAPVLGAAADERGSKKKSLMLFAILGVTATAAMFAIGQGDWILASGLFVLGNIGFAGANVFFDSLLPHVARPGEMDRVSTAGYALGYVGGGLLLAVNLAWILSPETFGFSGKQMAVRTSLFSVSLWWAGFAIPLFRKVSEPEVAKGIPTTAGVLRTGFRRLARTFREIRRYREVLLFLVGFWFYTDGIGTIIKMATVYGREIGIGSNHLIGALLLVQFLGIPATFAFGYFASRWGPKNGIMVCLVVYTGICILGFYMTAPWQFWALACLVAMVQGGCQGLSRSLYATLIPARKSSEFFSFISVSNKFAGIFGPIVFGAVSQIMGGSRFSILFLISFFVIGMILLGRVDVERGRRIALETDAQEAQQPG